MVVEKYFNQEEKAILFDFIIKYAKDIEKQHGGYNFKDEEVQNVLNANDVYIGTCKRKDDKINKDKHTYYLLFEHDKKNGVEDEAHDLLRHFRNAIVHSRILVDGDYLFLEDCQKKKKRPSEIYQTLDGKLNNCILLSLIEVLVRSKKH